MKWICDYWGLIVIALSALVVAACSIKRFVDLPRAQKVQEVKEWLLWAVVEAEKHFGSGTGTIKLRYVYDLFVKAFPTLARYISFTLFSSWVDEVLIRMKELIETNCNIKAYIEGEQWQ